MFGIDPDGFVARRLVFTAGQGASSRASRKSATFWPTAAPVAPGGTLRLGGRTFGIAGVFHAGITFQDLGVITTLSDAQALAGRTSQETTTIAIRLAPRVDAGAGRRRPAGEGLPGPLGDLRAKRGDPGWANSELISKAVLLIVVLALIIGALAVANTMLAAVLERRRELALLSTIGWSGAQLARWCSVRPSR